MGQDVRARALEAGLTGTAGALLPLHERLGRRVQVVIANAVASDPLAEADRAALLDQPREILRALEHVAGAVDAEQLWIAARGTDFPVMSALATARRSHPAVQVLSVEDVYPAGEASQLVLHATHRQVPPGAHPEDVGVMVINVHTLLLLAEAMRGLPMTWRYVTLAGVLEKPQVVRVPLGAILGEVLEKAGGLKRADAVLLAGPASRAREVSAQTPLSVGMPTVLALPPDHLLVQRGRLPFEQTLARASSTCGGCRACTERCPAALSGYRLAPHLLMRGLTQRQEQTEIVTGPASCLGCGLCEAVCPAGLSPGRLYGTVAGELRARGLSSLPSLPPGPVMAERVDRQVSRSWLVSRLGLAPYSEGLEVSRQLLPVSRVVLGLQGALPVVREGETVAVASPLALPQAGAGRVPLFSPLSGRVVRLTSDVVELRALDA